MKKYFLLSLVSLNVLVMYGQAQNETQNYFPEPRIDKRIELLSIVFRLAGNQEYNSTAFNSYVQDIYSHFNTYKDHPAVSFATKMHNENHVAFDAVMKIAWHIGQPPLFTPKVNFTDKVPEARWGAENAYKFLELLRDFYIVSDFENFYAEHSELYQIAVQKFLPIYEAVNIGWFNQYYGIKPGGSYHVIIGLGNGAPSYGGKIIYSDSTEEVYSILGTWVIDSTDIPIFEMDKYLPTLIHEFNHSYVNPLVDKYEAQLRKPGKIIFEPLEENFRQKAYGKWNIMMYESLVRACVIRYILNHDSYESAKKQLITETGNGFYWMQGLVNTLYDYEMNRDQYETMDSFMPVIVEFFNKVAKESETMFEIKF